MELPFTLEQFLDVFRRYNESVWPGQWLLLAAGVAAVALAMRGNRRSSGIAGALLAALWLWMGIVYHLLFFRSINPAAVLFGTAFIAQGLLFAWLGAWRGRILLAPRADAAGMAGGTLVVYALAIYPLLGATLGHAYPASPTFGLPCPTTILTLGLLLWARPGLPGVAYIVPVLWSAVGTSAAVRLGMREDLGLLAAGVATMIVGARMLTRPASRAA